MADYIATTGAAGVSSVIQAEYFQKVFLSTLEANLVFKRWANMASLPNHVGKTVYWPRVENITTGYTADMEGDDPAATAWSANEVSATLKEYKQWHRVSDFYKDTSVGGTLEQLIQRMAYKSALDVDTIIRDAVFTAGGSAQIGGTAVARTSMKNASIFYMDVDEVRQATASLRAANVPPAEDGYYVGIIHPYVEYDLQGDTEWQDIVKYTTAEHPRLTRAATAETFGVRFYSSSQANQISDGASAGASRDTYDTYVFGAEYLGMSDLGNLEMIIKDPAPASPLNSYMSVGWKYKFVAKQLASTRMRRIQTTSSQGT